MLAEECSFHANDTAHSRWRKAENCLDWSKFVSELEFIAKLPTGPEHIFDSFVGFFNDQFDFFMADMSAEEFKEHVILLDDLVLFMAYQQYKQKAQEGESWDSEVWAAMLANVQIYYRDCPFPGGKGHNDLDLWTSLFERSFRLLSK